MTVYLYVFKVAPKFSEEFGTRYIIRAHKLGTPESRWYDADSLLELYWNLEAAFPIASFWTAMEVDLENVGGFHVSLEIEEDAYDRLFTT